MRKRLLSLLLTLMMVLGLLPAAAYAAVGEGVSGVGQALANVGQALADNVAQTFATNNNSNANDNAARAQYAITLRRDHQEAFNLGIFLVDESNARIDPASGSNVTINGTVYNIGEETVSIEKLLSGFGLIEFQGYDGKTYTYVDAFWAGNSSSDPISTINYAEANRQANSWNWLYIRYTPLSTVNVPVTAVALENGAETSIAGAQASIAAGALNNERAQTVVSGASRSYALVRAEMRHKTNGTSIVVDSIQKSGNYYYTTSAETGNPTDVFSQEEWGLYLIYEPAYTLTINVSSSGTTWPNAALQTGNTINGVQIDQSARTYTFQIPTSGKLETTFNLNRYCNLRLTNVTNGANETVFSNHETTLGGYQTKSYTLVVDGTLISTDQTYNAVYTRVSDQSNATRRFFYPHYVNSSGSYHGGTLQWGRSSGTDSFSWSDLPKTEGSDGGYYKDIRAGEAISITVPVTGNVPYVPNTVVLNGTIINIPTGWTWDGSVTTSANYWQGDANDQIIYDTNGNIQAKVDVRLMLNYSGSKISGGRLRIVFEEIHGNIILDRANLAPSSYPDLILYEVGDGLSGTVRNSATAEQQLIPGAAIYPDQASGASAIVNVEFGYYVTQFRMNDNQVVRPPDTTAWHAREIRYWANDGGGTDGQTNYDAITANSTNRGYLETELVQFTLNYDRDGAAGGPAFNAGDSFTLPNSTSMTSAITEGMEPAGAGKVFVGWALKPNAQYGVDTLYQAGQTITRQAVEAAVSTAVTYSDEIGRATITLYPVMVDTSDAKLTSYSVQIHWDGTTQQYNYSGAVIGAVLTRDEILALSDVSSYVGNMTGYAMDGINSDAIVSVDDTGATTFHLYYYRTAYVNVTFVSAHGFDSNGSQEMDGATLVTEKTISTTPNNAYGDGKVPTPYQGADVEATFVGWSSYSPDDVSGALQLDSTSAAPQGDTTYYAVYTANVTVRFFQWTPSGSWASTAARTYSLPVGTSLSAGEESTINNLLTSHSGYASGQWAVGGPNSTPVTTDALMSQTFSTDTDIYAVYQPLSNITVTLNANGGTFTNSRTTITLENLTTGTSIVGSTGYEQPTRSGYIFAGWSPEQNATVGMLYPDVPASNDEYFAIWVRPNLNVAVSGSYTYNGQSQAPTITVEYNGQVVSSGYTVQYGTTTGTSSTAPTDAGTYSVVVTYNGVSGMGTYTIQPKQINATGVTIRPEWPQYNFNNQEIRAKILGTDSQVSGDRGTLTENTDFVVAYSSATTGGNLVDRGTINATVTGIGNYAGSVTKTYQILGNNGGIQAAAIPNQTYTGNEITPDLVVTGTTTGELLTVGEDYTVAYAEHTNVGQATVTITPTPSGNYSRSRAITVHFQIVPERLYVKVTPAQQVVGGGNPTINVYLTEADMNGSQNPLADSTYQLSYQRLYNGQTTTTNNTSQPGVYTITATGTGEYAGASGSATFVRVAASVGDTDLEIVGAPGNSVYNYDGTNHNTFAGSLGMNYTGSGGNTTLSPTWTVSYNGGNSESFDASYQIVDAGTYTITGTVTGTHEGSASFTVTVTPKNIGDSSIEFAIATDDSAYVDGGFQKTYTGSAMEHPFTLTDTGINNDRLTEGNGGDYVLVDPNHDNHTQVGTYPITIQGVGNYTGERTVNFEILPVTVTVSGTATLNYGYSQTEADAEAQRLADAATGILSVDEGNVTVDLYIDLGLAVGANQNHVHGSLTGTAAGNYTLVNTATVTVNRVDITDPGTGGGEGEGGGTTPSPIVASVHPGNAPFTGQPHDPFVLVQFGNEVLQEDTHYTLSYEYLGLDGSAAATEVGSMQSVGVYNIIITAVDSADNPISGSRKLRYEITSASTGGAGSSAGGLTISSINPVVYNGQAQKPSFTVQFGEDVLTEGEHYEVSITNGTDVGTATVTVTGKVGTDYAGMGAIATFQITPKTIGDVTVDVADQTYNGSQLTPKPASVIDTAIGANETLVEGVDYYLTWGTNINAGNGTVTLHGMGNYQSSKEVTFTIAAATLGDGTNPGASFQVSTYPTYGLYTGSPHSITLQVTYNGTVVPSSAYSVEVRNPSDQVVELATGIVDVGRYTITVTANSGSNYTGSAQTHYNVTPLSQTGEALLTVDTIENQQYTGSAIEPPVTVRHNGVVVESANYTVDYSAHTNVGQATVIVTGRADTGIAGLVAVVNFQITPKPISDASITVENIPAQTYSGSQITPELTIQDGGTTLVEGEDYTVTYSNNINVTNTALATIKGIGDYGQSREEEFVINAAAINQGGDQTAVNDGFTVNVYPQSAPFTGQAHTPDVMVHYGNILLDATTDYDVSYEAQSGSSLTGTSMVEPGSYYVVVAAKAGNYTGTVKVPYTITDAGTNQTVLGIEPITGWIYNGSVQQPNVVVYAYQNGAKVSEDPLTVDTDYTVTVSPADPNAAGQYIVTVTGANTYNGLQASAAFQVSPKEITHTDIQLTGVTADSTHPYTGSPITFNLSLTDGGRSSAPLVLNQDYTVAYESNTDVGDAKIIITGIGNYTGTKEIAFTITAMDVGDGSGSGGVTSGFMVNVYPASGPYTGAAHSPVVQVTWGNTVLQPETDYTLAWTNEGGNAGDLTEVGTYTVTVTGKGNYTGTATGTYTITQPGVGNASLDVGTITAKEYTGNVMTANELGLSVEAVLTGGNREELTLNTDYTVTFSPNNPKGAGVYQVTINGTGDYTGLTAVTTFEITAKDIGGDTITMAPTSITDQTYTGAAIEPEFTLTDSAVSGSNTLVDGTDYYLTYANNVEAGEATITVHGMGNYTGTRTITFNISKPSIGDGDTGGSGTPNTSFEVEVLPSSGTYNGQKHNPVVQVTYTPTGSSNPIILQQDVDYTLSWQGDLTGVGTHTATVTGQGNYSGTATATYTISAAGTGGGSSSFVLGVSQIADKTYTGSEISLTASDLTVTVYNSSGTQEAVLAEGEYSVSYDADTDRANVGTVLVTISATHDSYGTMETTVPFRIVPKDISTSAQVTKSLEYTTHAYTGSQLRPTVTVTDGDRNQALTLNTDFTVEYGENINVVDSSNNEGTVTIKGIGNYTGTAELTFDITSVSVDPDAPGSGEGGTTGGVMEVEVIPASRPYTGAKHDVRVQVTYTPTGGKPILLTETTDYTLAWSSTPTDLTELTDVGTYTATVTGKGNYSGEATATYIITAVNDPGTGEGGTTGGSTLAVVVTGDYTYTGSAIEPTLTVTYNGIELTEGDYTVDYGEGNTNAGVVHVTVTGAEGTNYAGMTGSTYFTIAPKPIDDPEITVGEIGAQTYIGSQIRPQVTVTDGDRTRATLVLNTDYTVEYGPNTDVVADGTQDGSVLVKGIGNYTGTQTVYFDITAASIGNGTSTSSGFQVQVIPTSGSYTGQAHTPAVQVTSNGTILTQDKDYTLAWNDASLTAAKTYTVTVTGTGNYTGSATATYTITTADAGSASLSVAVGGTFTYDGTPVTVEELKAQLTVTGLLASGANGETLNDAAYDVTINGSPTNAGTYQFTVTANDQSTNFNGLSATGSFRIEPKELNATGFTVSNIADQTYTGSGLTPQVYVQDTALNKDLAVNTDFTVSYSNNVNVTTSGSPAVATITGRGNYTGTITANFNIVAADVGGGTGGEDPDPTPDPSVVTANVYPATGVYNGSAHSPAIVVSRGNTNLQVGTDYTVQWSGNLTDVGTYTATITFQGNYQGTTKLEYNITAIENALTVQVGTVNKTYTGSEITLTTDELTVTSGSGQVLTEGTDYTVRYVSNINAGTAVVIVEGVSTGNYANMMGSATFEIARRSITEVEFTDIPDQAYTGSPVTPALSMTYNGKTLATPADYSVVFTNNVNSGENTAVATITGTGNFIGERTEHFTILSAGVDPENPSTGSTGTIVLQTIPDQTYTGSAIHPTVVVLWESADGQTWALTEGKDFDVVYGANTNVGAGTVTVHGKGSYSGLSDSGSFNIVAQLLHLDVEASPAQAEVGKGDPTITTRLDGNDIAGNVTLTYQKYDDTGALQTVDDLSEPGMYVITATGTGNYAGALGSTTFVRLPVDLGAGGLTVSGTDLQGGVITTTYTGANQIGVLSNIQVSDGSTELTEGIGYSISVAHNGTTTTLTAGNHSDYAMTEAGLYLVTITAIGTASGSSQIAVVVEPQDISNAHVEITNNNLPYTGNSQTASITVTDADLDTTNQTLTATTDYTVTNHTQTNAGDHTILVSGTGNFVGTVNATFTIEKAVLTLSKTQDFPASLTYGESMTLTAGTHFDVAGIHNNDDVTVTLLPIGEPTGGSTVEFQAILSGDAASNYTVTVPNDFVVHVNKKDVTAPGGGVDTDGDGIPNTQDPDIDGDGIPNGEDPDVDGDGILNGEDPDVDGDGIPNGQDPDVDGDGIPNGEDDDVDGDGLLNGEDYDDIDGDGIPNNQDPDIDGDGVPNTSDPDMDGDGIPNEEDEDADGDGIPDNQEPDIDGDGIPDDMDPDIDGDGIPNGEDDDVDGDGIPNGEDDDVDGDGIPNGEDPDVDGDDILNGSDPDVDGDGIPNGEDDDVDGDGIPNGEDDDVDGDGIPNGEDDDVDGDGIPNGEDDDVDGDGIPNGEDDDVDGDGKPNGEDHDDIDGDGIPNNQDPDIDGDGIPNGEDSDMDGDGIPNEEDEDADGDGIPDNQEPDTDGDEIPDDMDPDIDGDGKPNGEDDDVDGDGKPNGEDDDVDGDGIPNGEDPDVDGDDILNGEDPDIDGDGIPNEEDPDMDGDGIPNEEDPDADGDGVTDPGKDENGDKDDDQDGVVDDSDNDGDIQISMGDIVVTMTPSSAQFTGQAHVPAITVTDGGTTLTPNVHYTVSYHGPTTNGAMIEVGDYVVTVAFMGNYAGSFRLAYEITEVSAGSGDVDEDTDGDGNIEDGGDGTITVGNLIATMSPLSKYQGDETMPTITLLESGVTMDPSRYTVTYWNGSEQVTEMTDVGVYTVRVNGIDGYATSLAFDFTFTVMEVPAGGGGGGGTAPEGDDDLTDPEESGVSEWLETVAHNAYLQGYGNNLFNPDASMTRAEVAQLFYNLLLNKDVPITVSFDDVADTNWYATAVRTLASLGILNGSGDGNFYPNSPITRAEFTAIAMRFSNGNVVGQDIFSDVGPEHWFYEAVLGAVEYGWVVGYGDGIFAPYESIKRSEVTTIVNRMLYRVADEAYVDSHMGELTLFTDVTPDRWFFYQVVEATNGHAHSNTEGKETWTGLE